MDDLLEKKLDGQEEDSQKGKYLIFTLGNESYGIEIMYVTEIIGMQPVSKLPEQPDHSMGVINLRGKIIPVMDVGLRFRKEAHRHTKRACIIVIDVNDFSVGLVVERVCEVLIIPENDILPLPKLYSAENICVKGIGRVSDDVKLLLDCNKLISEEVTQNLLNC